jgi:hypothetical protein
MIYAADHDASTSTKAWWAEATRRRTSRELRARKGIIIA